MTFEKAISFCLTKGYAKFEGRASRSEFWWFWLFIMLCIIFVSIIINIYNALGGFVGHILFFGVILFIVLLGFTLPGLAVEVRRWHDLNCSGWFVLFNFLDLIPYLGIINTIVLYIIFMFKGTQGANRFGEDPLKKENLQENTEENLTNASSTTLKQEMSSNVKQSENLNLENEILEKNKEMIKENKTAWWVAYFIILIIALVVLFIFIQTH